MIFATMGGDSGFAGTATRATGTGGSSIIATLFYYRLAVMSDGTVFGQKLFKELSAST
jgi:hypothetical protein